MSIKEDTPNVRQRGDQPSGFLKKLKRSLFDDETRRSRFFTVVGNDGLSRSYLTHFIVIMVLIFGYYTYRNKRKGKNVKK
jgi:hypothetical protein